MSEATTEFPGAKVAVFHPGTQHSWQTARALQELGRLAFHATSIRYDPARWPYRLERLPVVGKRMHSEFARFRIPGIDPALVRTHGWHEWAERAAQRAGFPVLAERIDASGNLAFSAWAAREAKREGVGAVWGYDNSSLTAFRALEGSGVTRVLDVTVAPRRVLNRVMEGIEADWPDFVSPARRETLDYILDRCDEELRLADAIVVGSPFVRQTILDELGDPGLAERIHLLPYCFDEALFADVPEPTFRPAQKPVRLLFVGAIGPRKGAHLLLEAIAHIPPEMATLTMVGSLAMPERTFARYADRVTHVPNVPRAEIPGIMARHDALVLPSYFEGSAISLLEGLASGLALVQSRNAGLGVTSDTGIMLEEMSVEAVEAAILTLVGDRDRLLAMRHTATVRAEDFSFARYRANIHALLGTLGL